MKFCPICGTLIEEWEALCNDCWNRAKESRQNIIEIHNYSAYKRERIRLYKEISKIIATEAPALSEKIDMLLSKLLSGNQI